MRRLTTDKTVENMDMVELARNSCYAKDRKARYRDYDMDMDARDFARNLMSTLTKEELPLDDVSFDEEILENLQYDCFADIRGLIALFYRNLWAMADLRETLKTYEDAEEQGLLIRLPVVAGTVVYQICNNSDACYDCQHYSDFYGMDAMCDNVKVENVSGPRYADKPLCEKQFLEIIEFKADLDFIYRHRNDFGKTVFLTKEEAEAALAEKGGA